MMTRLSQLRTAISALAFAVMASMPTASPAQDDDFTINVDVELVDLAVSVLDEDGAPVFGLEREHFRVFEDGVEQEISRFNQEDVPISVGLVIDTSGSMVDRREKVAGAALVFLSESNQQDETFIVTFNDTAFLEQRFTGSLGTLVDTLDNLDARGETAMNDALWVSLDELENEARMEKKALLVITDGEDNASRYGVNPVLERLRDIDATVYIIGLLELNDDRGGLFRRSPSSRARRTLRDLAEATGGRAYFPETLDEVEEICRIIAHDLRNHYSLGYAPSNTAEDGSWREIEVDVEAPRGFPDLEVRARSGYYAPTSEESRGESREGSPEEGDTGSAAGQ